MFIRDRNDGCQALRDELWKTRQSVLGLSRVQLDFSSHYRCESREAGRQWLQNLIETAVSHAQTQPGQGWDQGSVYAHCPLCGGGVNDFYAGDRGFKVPVGLERHLEGWGQNAQCPVMNAAESLAREDWNERFRPQEAMEWQLKQDHLAQRRLDEDLYCINPRAEPLLLDENCYFGGPRSLDTDAPDGLSWAVQRLAALGLKRTAAPKRRGNGEVLSFVDQQTDYAVYADPRGKGRLSFLVVKLKNGKPAPVRDRFAALNKRFDLPDRWKNDLSNKYRDLVAKALALKS